jgi:hypothetical protein
MTDHRRRGRGGRRRAIWTVLTGGQTGPADSDGNRIVIPPRATNFRSRKRAQNLARQVKGARVVRSGPRFWTAKRVGLALIVIAVIVLIVRSR